MGWREPAAHRGVELLLRHGVEQGRFVVDQKHELHGTSRLANRFTIAPGHAPEKLPLAAPALHIRGGLLAWGYTMKAIAAVSSVAALLVAGTGSLLARQQQGTPPSWAYGFAGPPAAAAPGAQPAGQPQ